jgi:hypothetical protein
MTLRFLPEVLERTRIKAGLSRDELAKAAGVARGTVFNAENGQQQSARRREMQPSTRAGDVMGWLYWLLHWLWLWLHAFYGGESV